MLTSEPEQPNVNSGIVLAKRTRVVKPNHQQRNTKFEPLTNIPRSPKKKSDRGSYHSFNQLSYINWGPIVRLTILPGQQTKFGSVLIPPIFKPYRYSRIFSKSFRSSRETTSDKSLNLLVMLSNCSSACTRADTRSQLNYHYILEHQPSQVELNSRPRKWAVV